MPLAPPITLIVSDTLALPLAEIELSAIRSQGAGGQKVNKTSSAVQLRFDVVASSLADDVKARLLERSDRRITSDGVIVIKAQQHRKQEQNLDAALERDRKSVGKGKSVSVRVDPVGRRIIKKNN